MISNSLSVQRQLWPEKKPIFRSESKRKGTVSLFRHYLKSKTITNKQRIVCLVYPEITQISERSLYKLVKGSLDFKQRRNGKKKLKKNFNWGHFFLNWRHFFKKLGAFFFKIGDKKLFWDRENQLFWELY